MRRERRVRYRRSNFFYIIGVLIIVLAIILIILYRVYTKKLNDISKSMLSTEEIIGLIPNNTKDTKIQETKEDTESASTRLSKTIEEVKEDLDIDEKHETIAEIDDEINEIQDVKPNIEEPRPEAKKELTFEFPVKGDIIKDFAIDKLLYSDTLEEWTTHQGIDIKADRTTVVKAAEEGTVVAIKNDPRYGLSVIIEHQDGFKTVYSNLLTTEFVSEDEHVEKGQSIGTVGNSAVFEIVDVPHLHFEIIKDGEYVDPKMYLK